MAKFKYKSTKELTPKPGVTYSTTYYQQRTEEYQRTRQHIIAVVTEISAVSDLDKDLAVWILEPLKGFPRTQRQPNYSLVDIVTDMLGQVEARKDIPSGMLGRWNRLFYDTEWDIEMSHEYQSGAADPEVFNDLFDQ
jgi:hypothetical protein